MGHVDAQRIELGRQTSRLTQIGGHELAPIHQLTVGSDGRMLILGGPSRQEIFLADSGGRAIAQPTVLPEIGVPLAAPRASAFEGRNGVLVLDGGSPRWAKTEIAGSRWRVDSVTLTDLSGVSGLCTIEGHRYVMGKVGGARDAGLVHEVTMGGQVLRSFGKPFGTLDNPAVGYGQISCLPADRTIVVVSEVYPEVRAYSADGKTRWTAFIPGFVPMGFEVLGRLIRFTYPSDSVWDRAVAVFSPAPGVAAVQIGRQRGRTYRTKFESIRTVFFDLSTGRSIGSQMGLPLILTASRKSAYAVSEIDGDTLTVYRFTYRRGK